jgi:hypothetical protein
VLGWALIRNGKDTAADDYGLTTLLGLGGVFVIGVATLVPAIWSHDPDLLERCGRSRRRPPSAPTGDRAVKG